MDVISSVGGASPKSGSPPALSVTVWGTRGSIPVSGPQFSRYGGNTTCIEVRCGSRVMIFDCGSGIVPAGARIASEGISEIDLYLTHSHYDHILGFPFFRPLHMPGTVINIWTGHKHGQMTTRELIEGFMCPPWFPIGPAGLKATLGFHDFVPGAELQPVPELKISTAWLKHPDGAVGYRIEYGGKIFAIVTDTEHVPGQMDENVLALIDRADLFLYDSMFDDAEMERFRGFGHSSWQHAISLARAAGAARVGFIHHSFLQTDADLDRISVEAKRLFPAAEMFGDGQRVEL